MSFLFHCLLLLFYCPWMLADTPADCRYENAAGTWLFKIADFNHDCSKATNFTSTLQLELKFPNIAVDDLDRFGRWTLIYNQGFEVVHAHRKWLVMFAYDKDTSDYYCDRGMPGWTHDTLLRQWHCFVAVKLSNQTSLPVSRAQSKFSSGYAEALNEYDEFLATSPEYLKVSTPKAFSSQLASSQYDARYQPDQSLVNAINAVQSSWTAVEYPSHANYTLRQHILRSGGKPGQAAYPHLPGQSIPGVSRELELELAHLPSNFDWRSHRPNPITPVRDQGTCGSCYAFASAGAMEARIRLQSNFTANPILSPQDVVDCSPYSEGCNGGFQYLIAGKYAEDFGISTEQCIPYKGHDNDHCPSRKGCQRYYSTNYRYVGGYYGATNAQLIQLELVHKGPMPIGFNVYPDFKHYESGVYIHTNLQGKANKFDPFVLTNHAVMLVGYGVDDKTGLPYWLVKNSWSSDWGENGYFRILRGSNECGIESCVVSFDPVL